MLKCSKSQMKYKDCKNRAEIDYRSLRDSCNPLSDNEADDTINIRVLRSIASKLGYDYIMGMNSVHIVLEL